MILTHSDFEKITQRLNSTAAGILPEVATKLSYALNSAKLLASESIASTVMTMDSTALLRDGVSGRETTITITYPENVDVRANRFSVFSPVGIALLGRAAGNVVAWNTPMGLRQFEIVKVIYQPEAANQA